VRLCLKPDSDAEAVPSRKFSLAMVLHGSGISPSSTFPRPSKSSKSEAPVTILRDSQPAFDELTKTIANKSLD